MRRGALDRFRVADRRAAELEDDHGTVEQTAAHHQLGVEHRRARRAANDVVAHRDELDVEDRIRANAADDDGHSVARVDLPARLRLIGLIGDDDRPVGRARKPVRVRSAAPIGDRSLDVRRRPPSSRARSTCTPCGHARPATRFACALTGNSALAIVSPSTRAEELLNLDFDLRLFVADERNDVAENVERRQRPGYPAPETACIVIDDELRYAKTLMDRRERKRRDDRRAVAVRDDRSASTRDCVRCASMTSRCDGFTSAITSGTSGSIR